MRQRISIQTSLSIAAIALAAVAIFRTAPIGLDGASRAMAEEPPARFSAGEQRIAILNELKELNARMARIEQSLKTGVTVNVRDPDSDKQ